MDEKPKRSSSHNRLRVWLSQLVPSPDVRTGRRRLIAAGAIVFLAAFGVRLLHWQDYQLNVGADQAGLVSRYQQQAQRMLDGHGVLYPTGYQQHASVQLLLHPPGYSIFIATVFGLFGHSEDNVVRAQIICDSLAAVLVFVIAAQLLPIASSLIAGMLVAFSPQLALQSLLLLPESLAVPPILIAVYLLIRASKRPSLIPVLATGTMIGLACWLRSNALLLAPFLVVAIPSLFERGRRLKLAAALVLAAIVVISPITIRNWVVYGHFIPLSLGSGVTMIEGIADYDKENRFGMPATDDETARKDAEWHNRPDYVALWRPDGIERDRYRFSRGLDIIRKNPVWFAGVMIRRAGSMLRYNDSLSQGWPADTANAPIVSAEPSFGHQLVIAAEPVWSSTAEDLVANGRALSPRTECLLAEDRQTLTVAGNDSYFDDQFSSAPIAVAKNTDYMLKVAIKLIDGRGAVKVTTADRRIALASRILPSPETEPTITTAEGAQKEDDDNDSKSWIKPQPLAAIVDNLAAAYVLLPFATGDRAEVLLVVSNNGSSSARSKTKIGEAELYELGRTPHQWARFVRPAVRGIEKNIYQTSRVLPLIGLGITLLAAGRRWRALLVLLIVPAHYLSVQSVLHTEYRYILAIHYFLLTMASVALGGAALAVKRGFSFGGGQLRLLRPKGGL